LRLIASIAPCVLLMQLFLGAAYRHLQVTPTEADGRILHPVWAMHGHLGFAVVAVIVVLLAASRLSGAARGDSRLAPLGRCGAAMAIVVAVQVGLGFVAWGAVMMRKGPAIPGWELVSTSSHQATGALLLMLALQGAAWSRRLVERESTVTATVARA
jgi:hypothetical protein